MPVKVKKIGNYYYAAESSVTKASDLPLGRKHATKEGAVKQVQAINISMAKAGKFGPKAKRAVSKIKKKK